MPPDIDPDHNMCSRLHNTGDGSCRLDGLMSPDTCTSYFYDLFEAQKPWLEDALQKSEASWQVLVTHFPASWGQPGAIFQAFARKYGIDLILSGHVHNQQVWYKDALFGETAWVVTGGGGGIISEASPMLDGQDDQYGFVDLTFTKESILIETHSHGGVGNSSVVRNRTRVFPREPRG